MRPFLRARDRSRDAITGAYREEWARLVGVLGRRFGDLDIAEEAAAEAFAVAVERWASDGVPSNPGAGSPPPPAAKPSTESDARTSATKS